MGYITGYTNDACKTNQFYDEFQYKVNTCTDPELADHVFLQPACSGYGGEDGKADYSADKTFGSHLFGSGRTCFMDKPIPAVGLDYLKGWLKVYEGKRKYFTFQSLYTHTSYEDSHRDMDDMISKFLADVLG
jgi:hypothetical protein